MILLDNRVEDQITTRRLRVVKYRGSAHGTNEYPFLIDEGGISVLPVTSAELVYDVPDEVVSTGIAGLDAMLGAGGFFRGSSVLISGVAGTGKTTIGAYMVDAACARGERCLSFVFEESGEQICRNARSVGLDLKRHIDAGLLRFEAARPSLYGLEMHLARMHRDIRQFEPSVVVIDPVSALRGPPFDVHATLLRMVDMLKSRSITAVFTSLRADGAFDVAGDLGLSSLMDAWIKLVDVDADGERTRTLYVIKARGMSHSNQVREFIVTSDGIDLLDAYVGPAGVLTGTARVVQEAEERAAELRRRQNIERRKRDVVRRREAIERQIAELHARLDAEADEEGVLLAEDEARATTSEGERQAVASRRSAAE